MHCILANLTNWIQAVAAVAIVILTGLTLYVLYGYAADTKKIAKASVEQNILTHRPKLIIRSVVIPWMEILNRKTPLKVLNETKLDDGQLGGFFYAVNVGNQPATIRSLDEHMFFGDRLPMERPYEAGAGRRITNFRLQPGQSCKISFTPMATRSSELADTAVYEHPFFVIGRIVYVDELGNCRETGFCRRVDHHRERLVVVDDFDYEYAD
jgi:hypothetical protein